MMEPRYRAPVTKEEKQFQVIKPPALDDTTLSFKDISAPGDQNQLKPPAEPFVTPTEEVLNFQTENLTGMDSARARTTTAEGHLLSRVTTTGHTQGDRLITVPEEVPPADIVEDAVIQRLISTALFYILRINTLSLFLFALLTLVITWDISYLYPIGFLWGIDFFELLQMLRHSRKYRLTQKSRIKKALSCLGPITRTFASAGSKSILGIKLLMSCLGIAVALKMENSLTWEWREVLMSYWILFSIMIGFTIVAILCLVNRCCVFFFTDNEKSQVHGVLWGVLILAGISVLSCMLVINLRELIVHNLSSNILLSPFFAIIMYNLGMLLFTLGYYTEIEYLTVPGNFFKDLTALEIDVEPTQTYGMETKENQAKPQKIVVPKFLTKSSSTYYRRTTDVEINEYKQKRKKRLEKSKTKPKQVPKDSKKVIKHFKQRSVEMGANPKDVVPVPVVNSAEKAVNKTPKNDMLITIAETDQDKTIVTELGRNTHGKREDKGKDFFSGLTNRIGVLGIVPSVARRLGFPLKGKGKGKKGYDAQQDHEEAENKETMFNQSCNVPRVNMSALDIKEGEKQSASLRLRKTGRGQLEGKELQALEEKLRNIEAKSGGDIRERMIHSMYIKPGREHQDFSAMFENGNLNDSSLGEDPTKIKSGDNSMTQQCLICFDKPPDAVFMECGHGGVCYECSVDIWKATGECYLCREKIVQVLQIDMKSKLGGDVIKVISSTQMVNWE